MKKKRGLVITLVVLCLVLSVFAGYNLYLKSKEHIFYSPTGIVFYGISENIEPLVSYYHPFNGGRSAVWDYGVDKKIFVSVNSKDFFFWPEP